MEGRRLPRVPAESAGRLLRRLGRRPGGVHRCLARQPLACWIKRFAAYRVLSAAALCAIKWQDPRSRAHTVRDQQVALICGQKDPEMSAMRRNAQQIAPCNCMVARGCCAQHARTWCLRGVAHTTAGAGAAGDVGTAAGPRLEGHQVRACVSCFNLAHAQRLDPSACMCHGPHTGVHKSFN